VCFSRFFEVGFSLAENPLPSVFEINFFRFWRDREMKFPWWGSDNHEKKTDERRIETTFGEQDVCYPKQTFCFSVRLPFFRPFLFSSAYA
jgi:hypothetical protein